MLNLTPENGFQLGQDTQAITNHQNAQLITPPLSTKQSSSASSEKSQKADIVNKYITQASVFILSFWKNPTLNANLLFNQNEIKQNDYECFTREVLKRSRCSLLGLQVAMYYLFKLQKQIKDRFVHNNKALMCPKRTFLICLILSFKFNYDSNYSFKSWSKISGLSISEIKTLEFNILKELDYDLNCNVQNFKKWTSLLSQALEKIEKLIEAKTKRTEEAKNSLFSRKRQFSIEVEDNSVKRFRVEAI